MTAKAQNVELTEAFMEGSNNLRWSYLLKKIKGIIKLLTIFTKSFICSK